MTPHDFVAKWRQATLKERSAAQEHFIDLCRLLEEPTPAEVDPSGQWYCFEKGAKKAGGGDGWADVWKRGHFGWEYKGKGKDLDAALRQLQLYALALESPPLLVVSDLATIVIHTAFTGTVPETRRLTLDDLLLPEPRQWLKWAFSDPERWRPGQTRDGLTAQAAARFADLAQTLRERGHDPQAVAHFLNRLLFCLFAEDAGLLPQRLFTRLLDQGLQRPDRFASQLQNLFAAMAGGGDFGVEWIDWFNGGLFDDAHVLPLERPELDALRALAQLDWSAIEPAIFGTLFERGLDPAKRSQLGAHYTDAGSILRLIGPVIVEPLLAEWQAVKVAMSGDASKTRKKAQTAYQGFLERLRGFRVLDPACGSGNFLYLALQALKDLEHRVMLEAEALGWPRQFPTVGPECVKGIELNPYAAELARVTVWIGEIQWMLRHGYSLSRQPILRPLETIECQDALLTPLSPNPSPTRGEGSSVREADWPSADVIVGNPPFLGGSKLLRELGVDYLTTLRQRYAGRVPGGADLVCYWFEKARAQMAAGHALRAGLVATNSIRGGANRQVLERIIESEKLTIFNAWADEPWVNEGAAVRVSLVCFGAELPSPAGGRGVGGEGATLNGQPVAEIYADLTGRTVEAGGVDLTQARPLRENAGLSFQGSQKIGPFDIPGDLARQWLPLPNPHGRPNSEVLKPSWNGLDVVRRPRDGWIIDFGTEMPEIAAMRYEAPFEYVLQHVKPERERNPRPVRAKYWWRHGDPQPAMRAALKPLTRYIATPHVAKHRIFVWLPVSVLPDKMLIIIARSGDTTFGILHSRFHELWALRLGTSLEDRPRYTPTTCFETFPFPKGVLLDAHAPAIAAAARELHELRERWLNPPQWVDRIPEIVLGYPDRLIPKPEFAAELKKRTLTNLYNQRPAWLANLHRQLDEAVATAYGWSVDWPDEEILRRLLALNEERAG
ncbi:MAG TPA: class I SAM-dependent DNA methyltransferase [Candidatus Competibacteraceae bacterium]|nr:class I SAM-dependent DNA methyltransferase [Candidatus Competibacteraceae bacterium]HSA46933.1 class I SAM-dependent DNA methyltransferase [Candidatus Competibacteraceae bacterium]